MGETKNTKIAKVITNGEEHHLKKLTERTTIYLEPEVKKFVQLRALQTSQSASKLINDQLYIAMRKFESLNIIRRNKNQSVAEWEFVRKKWR